MKTIRFFLSLSFVLFLTIPMFSSGISMACKKYNAYQTECVSLNTDAYVVIRIWNAKKGLKYKMSNARKEAIHAILYAGIAGGNGCSTQPALLNTPEDRTNFKAIEKRFFSKKGEWARFTRDATDNSFGTKNDISATCKIYQVSIGRKDLRKYLEENKIIKPLNSGF
jgi:hypothetical protein